MLRDDNYSTCHGHRLAFQKNQEVSSSLYVHELYTRSFEKLVNVAQEVLNRIQIVRMKGGMLHFPSPLKIYFMRRKLQHLRCYYVMLPSCFAMSYQQHKRNSSIFRRE